MMNEVELHCAGLAQPQIESTCDFRAEVNMERATEGLDAIAMEEAIRYLKASKFNSGKALEIYRNYAKHVESYQIATMRPNRDPLSTEIASKKLTILDVVDPEGSPVMLLKAPQGDAKYSDSNAAYQLVFHQLDKLGKQSCVQDHGYILLVDAAGFSGSHTTYVNNVLAIVENGYPLLLKQSYVLNAKVSLLTALTSTKVKQISAPELLQLFSDDQVQSLCSSLNLPPGVQKAASHDKPRHTFTRAPSTPDFCSSTDGGGVGALVGMFDGRSNSSPSHSKPPQLPQTKTTGSQAVGSKSQPVGSKAKPTPPLKPTGAYRDDTCISTLSGNSVAKGNGMGNERDSVASQQGNVKSGTATESVGASLLSRQGTASSAKKIGPSTNNSPVTSVNSTGPAANIAGSSAANRTGSTGNGVTPAGSKQKIPLKPPTVKAAGGGASEEKVRGPGVGNNRDSPEPSEGRSRGSSDSSARVEHAASKVQQSAATSDIASVRQAAEDRSKQPLPGMSARKAVNGGGGGYTKVLAGASDVIPKPKLSAAKPQSASKQGVVGSAVEQTPSQGSGYEPPFMKLVAANPSPTSSVAANAYVNFTFNKPSHGYVNIAIGANGEVPLPALGGAKAQESGDDSDEESAWSGDENVADVVYENCGPDEYDRLMTVEELEGHIAARGNEGMGTEYLKLRNDRLSGAYRACREPCNMPKNRYKDVICYDNNRVILEGSELDYIHANYVNGYNKPHAFILTQGPLKKTIADFWKMVWDNSVLVIVMTTKFVEAAKVKCAEYWSDERPEQHGGVSIQVTKVEEFEGYEQRTMRVQCKGEERSLAHFQFLAWPDYGIPTNGSSVLSLLHAVRETQARQAKTVAGMPPYGPPVLVHCSAGVGRSGAFCAIDYCIDELRDLGRVNVQGAVRKLRSQRAYAIQTEEQYVLCYRTVLEYAKSVS